MNKRSLMDETLFTRLPSGTRALIEAAAATYGLTLSQYGRNAIVRALIGDGFEPPRILQPAPRKASK